MNELWEILVPTIMNDKPVRTAHHQQWDKYVIQFTGGLTVLRPAKGQWIEPDSGVLFKERMIPVRLACRRQDIDKIVQFTLSHYNQMAVMAYKLSSEVIIRERSDEECN